MHIPELHVWAVVDEPQIEVMALLPTRYVGARSTGVGGSRHLGHYRLQAPTYAFVVQPPVPVHPGLWIGERRLMALDGYKTGVKKACYGMCSYGRAYTGVRLNIDPFLRLHLHRRAPSPAAPASPTSGRSSSHTAGTCRRGGGSSGHRLCPGRSSDRRR